MLRTVLTNYSQEAGDFRIYLQTEFLRRTKRNPKYSLRAFAKTLGIEPSALSKIIGGKRSISRSQFRKLAHKLSLSPSQTEMYSKNIQECRGRSTGQKKALILLPSYQQLTEDAFQIIADWYHYAILELIALKGFRPDPKWIAKKLNLSLSEVSIALERLQRLKMLEIKNNKWVDKSQNITNISGDFTNAAKKSLQKQILEKALIAIDEVPFSKRNHTSMTMAIDSQLLPKANDCIVKFRRELCAILQESKNKDAVYELGVALFPVTQTLKHVGE